MRYDLYLSYAVSILSIAVNIILGEENANTC